LQVGLWSGVAIGPLIGGALADAYGFAMPFIVTAVLLALSGVLVHVGVEENLSPASSEVASAHSFIAEWRHVLSMHGVMLTYGLRFLIGLMRSMITPIAPLFMFVLLGSDSGVSTLTGLMVGLGSAAATVTAIYLGRLGDRVGHRKIVIGSAIAAGLLFLPQAFVTDAWQLILLYALAGAATGGLVSSPSALLAQFTDPGEEGAVYGIDNSIVAAARAISPLAGTGLAVWIGYRGVFVAVALIAFVLVVFAMRGLPEHRLKTA
jgi:DHA1 family multidrug resistance protein-like MFS transporter